MTDATTEFFQQLAARGHEPVLEKATGTIRFDLTDRGKRTSRWLVTIGEGDIKVSRGNAAADCVVRGERRLFDDIVAGKANAMAAVLRGAIQLEGDRGLVLAFQRVFQGPARRSS